MILYVRKKCLLLLLIVNMLPSVAFSQADGNFSFVKKNKKKLSLSFQLIHNLVIIPLQINDSDTLNFILDTGVHHTIITELPEGDSVQLHFAREINIKGLGKDEPIPALYSSANRISLQGIIGSRQDVVMLLDNNLMLSSSLGMDINGIIGYDLLKNFVIKVNYITKKITFYDPEHFVYRGKGEVIPFLLLKNKPYIIVKALQTNGTVFNAKVLVDMGASFGCSLYAFSDPEIHVPPHTISAFLGKGLGGDISGRIGRIEQLQIEGFKLQKPIISYPDEESTLFATEIVPHHGSVGAEVLRRFHFYIDYPHNRFILKPNYNFKKPFNFNLTGINVIQPYPGLPVYVADKITSGSPAELAGIREGDILVKVNGENTVQMSLSEILERLNSGVGGKIFIVIKREEDVKHFQIAVKDRI